MDIDLLEQRLAALELQVYPAKQTLNAANQTPVVDLLFQTHSMTSTALSCREAITSILRRMEIINDYLNPSYCDIQLDLQDKRQYILELFPELKNTIQLLVEFEQLKTVLDSTSIHNVPNLMSQLEHLTIANIDTHDECKIVTNRVLKALQRYNDITSTIKVIFAQMEGVMANIESSLQPAVKVDD